MTDERRCDICGHVLQFTEIQIQLWDESYEIYHCPDCGQDYEVVITWTKEDEEDS